MLPLGCSADELRMQLAWEENQHPSAANQVVSAVVVDENGKEILRSLIIGVKFHAEFGVVLESASHSFPLLKAVNQ
jgi:hypothetical protein